MIAPIRREPIDFMQEIPGTYDFRTGKIKYPQPEIFGGEIESPFDAYLGGLIASHDKPFSKYPPAVGATDGRYPGLSTDDIKRFVHPSLDPLLHIRDRPFGMQAGGPELFPIKKEPSGRVIKGTRKGVRTFEENDLKNQQGIIKASMDFLNQFNV